MGANIQGTYGSLAARLNQFVPGGSGIPGVYTFTNVSSLAIPGTTHNVGQAAMLFQLYDAAIPANAMAPGSYQVEVDTSTYDVFVAFSAPSSGYIALGITGPLYTATFAATTGPPYTVSILGTTHQLGTSDLQFQVYDAGSPRIAAIDPGSLTVHPTTHDVLISFVTPQSGRFILAPGGPQYATTFNLTTPPYAIDIAGSVHQLGTQALFFQLYDGATPRAALGDPGVTINPTTFDVHVAFVTPQSGRLVLSPATTLSGREFDIRDAGVVDQSAVRMHSLAGDLYLQAGLGQHVYVDDKLGAPKVTIETANGRVGIGTALPTHQLELSTGDAVKAGGGPWLAPSSDVLKEGVRPFTEGLEVLLALAPILFRYNGRGGLVRDGREYVGLAAEEVQQLVPAMVQRVRRRLEPGGEEVEILTLDSNPLVYLLVNAVKALHAMLLEGRQAVERLQQQVALLASSILPSEEPPQEERP